MAKTPSSQQSQVGSRPNTIELPGNTDSITSILGAALFGVTNANNLDALANESKNVKGGSLANALAVIGDIFNEDFISTIKESISSINTNITDINTTIKTTSETLKNIDTNFSMLYDNIDFDAFEGSINRLVKSIIDESKNNSKSLSVDLNNLNIVLTDNILKELNTIQKSVSNIEQKNDRIIDSLVGLGNNFNAEAAIAGDSDNTNVEGQQQTLNVALTDNILKELNTIQKSVSNIEQKNDRIIDSLVVLGNIFDGQAETATLGDSDNANVAGQQQTLNIVVTGVNNESLDLVKQLADVKLDENSLLSAESIDKLIEVYKKIDELFKLQVSVDANAQAALKANNSIQSSLDKTAESAVTAKQKQKDIEAASASVESIMKFIVGASFILIIGAAVMMIPGMVEASLKFAGVLAIFITAILTPILLLQFVQKALGSKFVKDKNGKDIPENINLLNGFVAACGFTMMIGALFMMIPGMVENSLKFTGVLALFIAGVSLAIQVLPKNAAIMGNLKQFADLVTVSTFVMMFGALFMMLGGGKLVKHALVFGLTLGLFIFTVLAPLFAFGALCGKAISSVEGLKNLIVVSTFVMLLGGLFMLLGGGKYVIYSLAFGLVLGAFIGTILAPILLFSMFSKHAEKTLAKLTTLIIVSTIIMMLGSLFTMNTKLVVHALAFGLLLSTFITLVLTPLLIFTLLSKKATKSLTSFTAIILVSTLVLLIGSYFMQDTKRIIGAIAFTILLTAFIAGTLFAFNAASGRYKPTLKHAGSFALIVGVAGAILMLGGYIMSKYGWETLGFAALLFAFIIGTMASINLVTKNYKNIVAASLAFKQLAVGIGIISVAIGLLAIIGSQYGWDNVIYAATTLLTVTTIIIGLFALCKLNNKTINVGTTAASSLGLGLLALSAAIGILAGVGYIFGWDNVLLGGITLSAVIGILCYIFSLASSKMAAIQKGTVAIGNLGEGLLKISAAIGILAGIGYIFGWNNVLVGGVTLSAVIGILCGVFALASSKMTTIQKGADAIDSIGKGLLKVTIAIGVLALISSIFGWESVVVGATTLVGVIGILCGVFVLASSKMDAIQKGAAAIGAMATGLLIVSAAIGILAIIAGEYGWDSVVVAAGTLVATIGILCGLFVIIDTFKAQILAGVAILTAMSMGVMAVSASIALLGFIAGEYGWETVVAAAGTLVVTVGLLAAVFGVVGIPPVAALVGLGSVVLLGMSAAIGVLTLVIWSIVSIIDKYGEDTIKKAPSVIVSFLTGMTGVFATCIGFTLTAPFALIGITAMIAPITLLSTLLRIMGNAIIIYRKGVDGFDVSKLGASLSSFINAMPSLSIKDYVTMTLNASRILQLVHIMSNVMFILSSAIESYANLRVATKWDERGNPIKFRQLDSNDFAEAGKSVEVIMVTIGRAFKTTYEENKEWLFESDDFYKKLYKIQFLTVTQGRILDMLADSIRSYAQLMVPTKWDKNGKPIRFRLLTSEDFTNAAEGVAKIMTTLAGAMNTVYTTNKDWLFESDDFYKKLYRIRTLTATQGEILNVLSEGIQSYAQILIPTKWNKDGVAIGYRQMKSEEFGQAAENIAKIVTTLAMAVKYTFSGGKHKIGDTEIDFYDGLGWLGLFLPTMTRSLLPLGELVSSLAEGMMSYAKLQIPIKWDKKGRPIAFEMMSPETFGKAGENIGLVITSLATAVNDAYENIMPNGVWARWFGPSPEEKIKALEPLGNLISSIAEGVQNYANLNVPIAWDSKGRPKAFRPMSGDDFTKAGERISDVLLAVAGSVSVAWNGGKITFSDGSGWSFGRGIRHMCDADELKTIIDAFSEIGGLIESIAEGVQSYANLNVPISWDSKGRPNAFRQMTSKDFEKAAQNISDMLLTIGASIKIAWMGGTLVFSDGSSWTIGTGINKMCDADDFKTIIESFSEIGDLIGNVAEGVQKYANLMIPTYGNDGKIVGARQMSESDFSAAGKNIVTVLMTLLTGNSTPDISNKSSITSGLIGAYNLLKRYDIEDDFGEIVEMFGTTGELISNIAAGIQSYADLKIATGWDSEGKPTSFRKLSKNDFENASNNIMTVLGTVLFGANSVSDKGITVKGGIVGFYNKLYSYGIEEDIKEIIESFVPAGELISSMAESIGAFSKMQFATAWNAEGKPIAFTKITSNDIVDASKNIMKVLGITLFGANAIDENGGIKDRSKITGGIVGFNYQLERFGLDGEIKEVLESLLPAGNLISSLAESIATYSKMQFATAWNSEGKPTAFRPMTGAEMISASLNIMNILGTMLFGANAVSDKGITVTGGIVGFYNKLSLYNIESDIKEIIESMEPVGKLLDSMATGVSAFAQMMVPNKWNAEGKAIGFRELTPKDFTSVNVNIAKLMTTLTNAVKDAYINSIKPVLDDGGDFTEAVKSIALIGNAVKDIADGVQAYAEMRIPTGWDAEGKATGYKKMPDNYINTAKDNIKNIIITLAEAISETWKGSNEKDGINKILPSNIIQKITEKIHEINNVIVSVGTLVSGIADMKIATAWDAEGKPTKFISITTEDKDIFTKIKNNINSLLTEIPLGLYTAYTNNTHLFNASNSNSYTKKIINILPDLNSVLLQLKVVLDTFGTGDWMKNVYAYKKRTTKKLEGIDLSIGMFADTYVITDEISTLITKLVGIPSVGKEIDTIDTSFSILSSRISELAGAINEYYVNKAFEENINRVSRFVSETVNTLDVEKIDHLIALIESMNRLSDKTTTLDSLTNAIANNLSVVLKQLGDKMTEAKATIEITEKIQEKRHKLINDSIAKVKDIMANEIVVTVNTSNNSSNTSTGSTSSSSGTSTGSTSSGGGMGSGIQSNIGDGTGAAAESTPTGNTLGGSTQSNIQQGNTKQNTNTNNTANTQSSTINDMAEKINRIYNIIQERF